MSQLNKYWFLNSPSHHAVLLTTFYIMWPRQRLTTYQLDLNIGRLQTGHSQIEVTTENRVSSPYRKTRKVTERPSSKSLLATSHASLGAVLCGARWWMHEQHRLRLTFMDTYSCQSSSQDCGCCRLENLRPESSFRKMVTIFRPVTAAQSFTDLSATFQEEWHALPLQKITCE